MIKSKNFRHDFMPVNTKNEKNVIKIVTNRKLQSETILKFFNSEELLLKNILYCERKGGKIK